MNHKGSSWLSAAEQGIKLEERARRLARKAGQTYGIGDVTPFSRRCVAEQREMEARTASNHPDAIRFRRES